MVRSEPWVQEATHEHSSLGRGLSFVAAHLGKSDVLIKLAVNGVDYTTDGNAVDPTQKNGFATFSVTAP